MDPNSVLQSYGASLSLLSCLSITWREQSHSLPDFEAFPDLAFSVLADHIHNPKYKNVKQFRFTLYLKEQRGKKATLMFCIFTYEYKHQTFIKVQSLEVRTEEVRMMALAVWSQRLLKNADFRHLHVRCSSLKMESGQSGIGVVAQILSQKARRGSGGPRSPSPRADAKITAIIKCMDGSKQLNASNLNQSRKSP